MIHRSHTSFCDPIMLTGGTILKSPKLCATSATDNRGRSYSSHTILALGSALFSQHSVTMECKQLTSRGLYRSSTVIILEACSIFLWELPVIISYR